MSKLECNEKVAKLIVLFTSKKTIYDFLYRILTSSDISNFIESDIKINPIDGSDEEQKAKAQFYNQRCAVILEMGKVIYEKLVNMKNTCFNDIIYLSNIITSLKTQDSSIDYVVNVTQDYFNNQLREIIDSYSQEEYLKDVESIINIFYENVIDNLKNKNYVTLLENICNTDDKISFA